MKLTTHSKFFFRPERRILFFPWRSLEGGSSYPDDPARCIYFYSEVEDCESPPGQPFYAGQRLHAHALAKSRGLHHYKRWWPHHIGQLVRCDVFTINDRHFNAAHTPHNNRMKLQSIEYLTARLIERRLRPRMPLAANQGFQFTYAWTKSADVRAIAWDILDQSKTIW